MIPPPRALRAAAAAALALACGVTTTTASAASPASALPEAVTVPAVTMPTIDGPAAPGTFLVGRGISDTTGEIAGAPMIGYFDLKQVSEGLHDRLRSRAFIIADPATGKRVVLVTVDNGFIFDSMHKAVLDRLKALYGATYGIGNVLITSTHDHAGPGGTSHHLLYNVTTYGFHQREFKATVDGIVESIQRAHADLQPSELTWSTGQLSGANANRSKVAFDRNPADVTSFFPNGVDEQTTDLTVRRAGSVVGLINWFPTHGTSLPNTNKLISGDNKGYAAYRYEREVSGVDYLATTKPAMITAFAQTNSGDMSPNLDLRPATPETQWQRTMDIGGRQQEAAARLTSENTVPVGAGVDSRTMYVDLAGTDVAGAYADGRTHRTCGPAVGAAMAAGSTEDGAAFPGFQEGSNPFFDKTSSVMYSVDPGFAACQAPKSVFVDGRALNAIWPWIQTRVPVTVARIGQLWLVGIPGEVTIGSGLRLRQSVAEAVGTDVGNVLVQGYTNSYIHYVTTPEEYDAQQYEGGSTLFGRWELGAFRQTSAALARAIADGTTPPLGPVSPDLSGYQLVRYPSDPPDQTIFSLAFGSVVTQPAAAYTRGQTASAQFAGAHPHNVVRRGRTYLEVQRLVGSTWVRVADDGDWSTTFRWQRSGLAGSLITCSWTVPQDAAAGTYRIRYHGDTTSLGFALPITGTSRTFTVS